MGHTHVHNRVCVPACVRAGEKERAREIEGLRKCRVSVTSASNQFYKEAKLCKEPSVRTQTDPKEKNTYVPTSHHHQ